MFHDALINATLTQTTTLEPVSTIVWVKSHATPVVKVKKECASRNLLFAIPATLMSCYVTGFQPSFIHASIAISSNPWDKLSVDDMQDLFAAVFPEVTHEIVFGDVFYSLVNFVWCLHFLYSNEFFRQTRLPA